MARGDLLCKGFPSLMGSTPYSVLRSLQGASPACPFDSRGSLLRCRALLIPVRVVQSRRPPHPPPNSMVAHRSILPSRIETSSVCLIFVASAAQCRLGYGWSCLHLVFELYITCRGTCRRPRRDPSGREQSHGRRSIRRRQASAPGWTRWLQSDDSSVAPMTTGKASWALSSRRVLVRRFKCGSRPRLRRRCRGKDPGPGPRLSRSGAGGAGGASRVRYSSLYETLPSLLLLRTPQ